MALTSQQLNNAMQHFYGGVASVNKGFQIKTGKEMAEKYNTLTTDLSIVGLQGDDKKKRIGDLYLQFRQEGMGDTDALQAALKALGKPVTVDNQAAATSASVPATTVNPYSPTTWEQDQARSYASSLTQGLFDTSVQRNQSAYKPRNFIMPDFSI
jgi:hypothetical protein